MKTNSEELVVIDGDLNARVRTSTREQEYAYETPLKAALDIRREASERGVQWNTLLRVFWIR